MEEIKIVNEEGEVQETSKEPNPTETVESGFSDEMMSTAVEQMLNLSREDAGKYKHKIETLVNYAKQYSTGKSIEDFKWAIRDLQLKIGTSPLTENPILHLARIAYLKMERDNIDRELKKIS